MTKKNKILLRIAIIVLVVTLITALVLSSVYAKYVSDANSPNVSGRPAAFEVVMKTPLDEGFEVNFAVDGEPGAPIGYTEVTKDYEFSVITDTSEVASDYSLELVFAPNVADKIRQAREDRFVDGLWCDFKVYMGSKSGDNIVYSETPLSGVEIGFDDEGDSLTWSCVEKLTPNSNPGGKEGETCYKITMTFYNNTLMTYKMVNGVKVYNCDDYLFASEGIEIKVTSKQIDPGFKGKHVYS